MVLPRWSYKGKVIGGIEDFEVVPFGFIYLLEFRGKWYYCGKKSIFSEREMDVLKSGEKRSGHVKYVHHNKDCHRIQREIVRAQSDWLTYTGSCKETEGHVLENRIILETVPTQRALTYCEVKWLFQLDALENSRFLNGNILGKFYRGNLA